MTPYDCDFIKRKIKEKNDFIRSQMQLRKSERDQRAIDNAKAAIARMNDWLKGEPLPGHTVVETNSSRPLDREEFKQGFKEAFGLQEPEATMKIDTIEDLKKAWPNIKGKNIQIEAPAEVKKELMRLYREEFGHIHQKGFRPIQL